MRAAAKEIIYAAWNRQPQPNQREPYVPPRVPFAWVPNVEYYVIIIPATVAFLVAYIHFVGILSLHFYGIFDRDLHDKLYGSNQQATTGGTTQVSVQPPPDEPDKPVQPPPDEPDEPDEPDKPVEPPPDEPDEPVQPPPDEPSNEQAVLRADEQAEEQAQEPTEELTEEDMEFFDLLPESSTKQNEEPEMPANASKQNIEFRAYYTNLHPLLNAMVPFFIANGVLIFRVACCYNRMVLKVLHTVLLVLPIPQVLISVPYIMSWTKYVDNPLKDQHFWSLHCWMGLIFILLFFITLISGIYVYFYMPKKAPFESCEFRAKFTPYHSFMGTVLFIICVMQVITGITSTAKLLTWDTWKADDGAHTAKFGSRMLSLKISALLYAISGMTVIYALYREDFRYRGRIIITADPHHIR